MITLNLKMETGSKKLMVKEDVLFNALLSKHPAAIKKVINFVDKKYKINNKKFLIINQFIDFKENGMSQYPGLIVRTDKNEFVVLYLEKTKIDEEYMVNIIKNFVLESSEYEPDTITINRFEIDMDAFLYALEYKEE